MIVIMIASLVYLMSFYLLFTSCTETNNCFKFTIRIENINYEAFITTENVTKNPLFSENTRILLQRENGNLTYNLQQTNIKSVHGYIASKPHSSFVSGFIANNNFFGKINIDHKNYPVTKKISSTCKSNPFFYEQFNSRYMDFRPYKIQYLKEPKRIGRTCSLLLLIDNSFFRIIAKNNYKTAILIILHSLDQANSIFRSTDFDDDGWPDNIGFKIKYIVIIASENTSINILPKYTPEAIDGKTYLFLLSKYRLLSEVCLGIAFTAQPFLHRALGLSYTAIKDMPSFQIPNAGGICERPSRLGLQENFNNLVISYALENNHRVPKITTDLSLAHELGHSFGSDHDEKSCYGHLMTAHTFDKAKLENFIFSECSKKQIFEVLKKKGHCLELDPNPYCGNEIVEENEDCDCGDAANCIERDICCNPQDSEDSPCKVNRNAGYECHPSQGLCCETNCQYKNISFLGLDCEDMKNSCPCDNSNTCTCGLNSKCVKDECHSIECTRIGLLECPCPENLSKKCSICCLNTGVNKTCLSSSVFTKLLIENNNLSINELKSYEWKNKILPAGTKLQKFCNQKFCINLEFRSFDVDDYCIYRGKLGMCNEKLKCLTDNMKQIYPTIKKVVANSQKLITSSVLYFGIIIFNYIINTSKIYLLY